MTLKLRKPNVRQLLLIDGVGALLSAFLLGVVLVKYEVTFGIPVKSLYLLAAIPIFFALYDFTCYLSKSKKTARLLQIIASANLVYCLISLALAWSHRETITLWGWGYLIAEVLIVVALAIIEFKTAKRNP